MTKRPFVCKIIEYPNSQLNRRRTFRLNFARAQKGTSAHSEIGIRSKFRGTPCYALTVTSNIETRTVEIGLKQTAV